MTTAPLARRTSGTGARSLLLTILGEFVLPGPGTTWTGAFVEALAQVGVEQKAARQAIARTAAEGLIQAERVGRRTRWALTRSGRVLLEDGARRIYGFMREPHRWDGQWVVLAVTVPETQRQLRHRLRTRLAWVGMGSPTPGLWVVPDVERARAIARIVADLDIGHSVMSWTGPSGLVGDPRDVVAAAWSSLDEVERAYEDFVADFSDRRTASSPGAFVAQVDLVQAWRRFPLIDPDLPVELLDHDWPGPRAAEVFHGCHDAWHEAAQAHWSTLCADAESRS